MTIQMDTVSDDEWLELKEEIDAWFQGKRSPKIHKQIQEMWHSGFMFAGQRADKKEEIEDAWNDVWLRRSGWSGNRVRGWARVLRLPIPGDLLKNVDDETSNRSIRKLALEVHGSKEELECHCGATDSTSEMEAPSITRCYKCKSDFCASHWDGQRFNMKYSPHRGVHHGGRGEFRWICGDCIVRHHKANGRY